MPALQAGEIAKVANEIDGSQSKKTIDAKGLYVVPGLIVFFDCEPSISLATLAILPALQAGEIFLYLKNRLLINLKHVCLPF